MEFQQRFATEDDCREYLFASRWPEGFVCPGCGGGRAGGETRRHLWVCTACGHQTSVTAGTVMHGTRTPLRAWFWAAYLVATHHPGISAKQLQRQLGLSRYETAWLILQKLRRAMIAPERTLLTQDVELDEFYLGGHEEGLKGGRQRGKKALCGVAIEVRGQGSGRLRLAVLPDASGPALLAFTQATTAPGAIVRTDGLAVLQDTRQARLRPSPSPAEQRRGGRSAAAARAHRAISNLKAWMTAPTAASATGTSPSTSTNTCSATTAASPQWPPSRHSSASVHCTSPRPTARSLAETPPEPYLESTGYASGE